MSGDTPSCRDNQIITWDVSAVRAIARVRKIPAQRAAHASGKTGGKGGGGGGRTFFFFDRREMNFVALVPVKHGNDAPWARSRTPRSSLDGHLVESRLVSRRRSGIYS